MNATPQRRRPSTQFLFFLLLLSLTPAVLGAIAFWPLFEELLHADPTAWQQLAPDVYGSRDLPRQYVLKDGEASLCIDAGATPRFEGQIDKVLLTHHHADSCANVGWFREKSISVLAPKASADWLEKEAVTKFWKDSIPLRNSRTAYFVVPEGFTGLDYSLEDGKTITWKSWTIQVIATPGHSRDHVAYAARKGKDGPLYVFCGDAFCQEGKLWTPYTTDWDHWTDVGLKPTAASLRKLAALKPDILFPAHGPVVAKDCAGVLERTAAAVDEVGFLKSYERFTVQRLGDQPQYPFLAQEQAESNGSRPWTKVSEHLFLTGNTYVLVSRDKACLVFDPWDVRSADQLAKLRKEQQLGPIEVVLFSHAHYDHFDGIYHLPDRDKLQTWALDLVATPLEQPTLLRAPFLDARPVKIDRRFKDGESATWREYRLRFHHLPGQSYFTMAVETEIDDKRCLFTADNFFQQYQFSGSGGWMGLNRSTPVLYAESAEKVLRLRPEWVLAEHGGPFEFNAEDFRRRVEWGKAAGKAADAVCVSKNHRDDWNPHRFRVEPILQKAKPGTELTWTFAAEPLDQPARDFKLRGRGVIADATIKVEGKAGEPAKREFRTKVSDKATPGRHVFVFDEGRCDIYFAIDVE